MARRPEPPPPAEPITREDLQRGFAGVQRGFRKQVHDKKTSLITIGAGVGLVVVIVVFLLGRRSGNKKTTFVEIRRV